MATMERLGDIVQQNTLAPCRVIALQNISLSGLQTVDGIAVGSGDRVLVNKQDNLAENGIYIANTNMWARAPDWNEQSDVNTGTLIAVYEGSNEALYQASYTGSLLVGTTEVVFVLVYKALDTSAALDIRESGIVLSSDPTSASQDTLLNTFIDQLVTDRGQAQIYLPPPLNGDGVVIADSINWKRGIGVGGSVRRGRFIAADNFVDMQPVFRQHPTDPLGAFYSNQDGSLESGNYFKFMENIQIDMSQVNADAIGFFSDRHMNRTIIDNVSTVGNPAQKQIGEYYFHSDPNTNSATFPYHVLHRFCDFDDLYGPRAVIWQGNDLLQSRANNNLYYYCKFSGYNSAMDMRGIGNKTYGTVFNKQSTSGTYSHHEGPIEWDLATERFRGSDGAGNFSDSLKNGRRFRVYYSDGTANTHNENWDEQNAVSAFARATGTRTDAVTLSLLGMSPTIKSPTQISDVVGTVGNVCVYVDASNVTVIGDLTSTYLIGRSIVLYSRNWADRNGVDNFGDSYFGESYTTITGSTYDSGTGLTTITIAGAFATATTLALREIDTATRISNTEFTIIKSDTEDYAVGYKVDVEMDITRGLGSSTITAIPSAIVATYVSANSVLVTGADVTTDYPVAARVWVNGTAGTLSSAITTSTFASGNTTIVFADNGVPATGTLTILNQAVKITLADPIVTATSGSIVVRPYFRNSRVPLNGLDGLFQQNITVADNLTVGKLLIDGSANMITILDTSASLRNAIEIFATSAGGNIYFGRNGTDQLIIRGTGSLIGNIQGLGTHHLIWNGLGGTPVFTVDASGFVRVDGDLQIKDDLLLEGILKVSGIKVLGPQGAAVSDVTVTYTSNAPGATNGSVTIADGSAPTNAELLELVEELRNEVEAIASRDRAHGLYT